MPWIQAAQPSLCLFIQASRTDCRYVVVERSQAAPKLLGGGSFELQEQPLTAQVRDHAAAQNLRVRHAVLLLPRSELEMVSLHLPPASESELPELVQGALLQEQDDAATRPVSDFLITHHDGESTEVTVFSVDESSVDRWKAEFKAAGLNLIGVTFSGAGAAEMLPAILSDMDQTNVVITMSDQDLDLVVSTGARPVLFRTIPWSAEDDHQLADRLGEEIPRTISLAHHLREDDSPRIHLAGDLGEYESQLRSLSELIADPVSMIDPLDLVQSRTTLANPSRYANLIGVALAWNRGGLSLNLLAPRRPAVPAGPWRKLAVAGALVAVIVLMLGYQVWSERSAELHAIEDRQQKLKKLSKRADKSRELQALADAISDWRRDDIAWIDELRGLAERLPSSDQALVRKMNLSIDAQRQGIIDLSVQVSKPEIVTLLEDALRAGERSVSSKRVSESDEKSKLPWGFDTRVVFQPAELPDLPVPEDTKSTAADDAAAEETQRDALSERESS